MFTRALYGKYTALMNDIAAQAEPIPAALTQGEVDRWLKMYDTGAAEVHNAIQLYKSHITSDDS